MNIKSHRKNLLGRAGIMAALIAAIFAVPALHAQPTEQTVQSRFLFIFETSSGMKSRVEATQKAVQAMLTTSLSGHLHSGDSIGVWTFNQDLQAGNYPLQIWDADKAPVIAASLTTFVGDQHYGKTARFEALQPLLNQVVQGSERLTVLIFCDGATKFSGTPFDDGVNQAIQPKLAGQNKARQPFIILLRSQLGKFSGCAMSFPPEPLNIPEFPPLPAPPPRPALKPVNPPTPPATTEVVPPLIVIGTKTSPPSETNSPPTNTPPLPPIVPTPGASIQPTNADASATNPVMAKITKPASINSAAPPDDPGNGGKKFLVIGAGLLGAAIALGIVVWLGSPRKDSSLITRSMNQHR
jgi:hypothetical protein